MDRHPDIDPKCIMFDSPLYLQDDGGLSETQEAATLQPGLDPALNEDHASHDGRVQRFVQQQLLTLSQEHLSHSPHFTL